MQRLAACGHLSASSQSLRFILSLRLYSSFITSRPVLLRKHTCLLFSRGGGGVQSPCPPPLDPRMHAPKMLKLDRSVFDMNATYREIMFLFLMYAYQDGHHNGRRTIENTSANSEEFRGIRHRMYIEDLL